MQRGASSVRLMGSESHIAEEQKLQKADPPPTRQHKLTSRGGGVQTCACGLIKKGEEIKQEPTGGKPCG